MTQGELLEEQGCRPVQEGAAHAFPLADGVVRVTASVGVTVTRDLELDTVVRQADVAMYAAKAHGKSRFELAANDTPAPSDWR